MPPPPLTAVPVHLHDLNSALVSCKMTEPDIAEMRIDAWAFPYGGVGPLVALAVAYGFEVVGLNECGRFETREEWLGGAE